MLYTVFTSLGDRGCGHREVTTYRLGGSKERVGTLVTPTTTGSSKFKASACWGSADNTITSPPMSRDYEDSQQQAIETNDSTCVKPLPKAKTPDTVYSPNVLLLVHCHRVLQCIPPSCWIHTYPALTPSLHTSLTWSSRFSQQDPADFFPSVCTHPQPPQQIISA